MAKRNTHVVGDDGRDETGRRPRTATPTSLEAPLDAPVEHGDHLDATPSPAPAAGSAFDRDVRDALNRGEVSQARSLVADAEAVLHAHRLQRASDRDGGSGTAVTRPEVASAKARIAAAIGDTVAAHAILVQAIEADPDVAHLRTLMTEVMMASGRATDVRPVLHHLGRAPAQVEAPGTRPEPASKTRTR